MYIFLIESVENLIRSLIKKLNFYINNSIRQNQLYNSSQNNPLKNSFSQSFPIFFNLRCSFIIYQPSRFYHLIKQNEKKKISTILLTLKINKY